jgi:hypothetical protein
VPEGVPVAATRTELFGGKCPSTNAVDSNSPRQQNAAFGDDAGITLMELLPPVGWADVATKQDLVLLRGELELLRRDLDARFERGFRQVIVTMVSLMVSGFFAIVAATILR